MSSPTIPAVEQITGGGFAGRILRHWLKLAWARVFSFPVMLVAGLTFLVFWTCAERFDDPDLWWHLKLGETMWASHQIPNSDQFSFTAHGSAWIAHEWLPQVVLYSVYRAGGFVALHIGFSLLASLIVALAYLLCSLWSGNWKVSILGGFGALFFLTESLAIRPLLFGHLFLLLELLLLYVGLVRGSRWIWALPVLFVVWTNSHGSFLFGLVVLAAAVGGKILQKRSLRDVRPWILLLALCLLAPLVNPIGPQLAVYPVNLMFFQPDNTGNVEEWAPLNLFHPRGIGLALVIGFVLTMVIAFGRKLLLWEWVALAVTTGMALQHVRMLPIFAFIAFPIVCRMLREDWDNYDPRRDYPVLNAVLIAIAAVASIAVLPDLPAIRQQIAAHEPVAAVAKMQQMGWPGPVLNEYAWGGFLMWSDSQQPVFIDGRTDIYAWNGVMRDYGRWALLEDDPKILLDRFGIRTCVLRSTAPMAHVLPYLPGWKQVYADNLAVIFTRR